MSQEQDRIFFRNFSIIVVALAIMMGLFLAAAFWVGGDAASHAELREAEVAERTAPVGEVAVEGEEPSAEAEEMASGEDMAQASLSGEAVYNQMCVACHGIAGIGAPVTGNVDEWAPRIAKGMDVLYDHAINGFTGPEGFMMPARGGGSFSDDEVKAAVDYMVQNSQ